MCLRLFENKQHIKPKTINIFKSRKRLTLDCKGITAEETFVGFLLKMISQYVKFNACKNKER